MAIPVLFANDFVVVIDKPAMTLSVPARFADDPRPVVGRQLEVELSRRLWPVHRLDFEVSGVMVFALDSASHKLLNSAFEKRLVQKTYQAFTSDTPVSWAEPYEARWKSRILRGKKRSYESPHGQDAITDAKLVTHHCLKSDSHASVNALEWQLRPLTGKPHQLRYEMYKHQVPIIGDTLYGSTWTVDDGMALKAIKLEWPEDLQLQLQLPQKIVAPGLTIKIN